MKKIVIVGGGIGGLTAAYKLSLTGKYDIYVYEKNDQLGGRVLSQNHDGFNFDFGAIMIPNWYTQTKELIKALNIDLDESKGVKMQLTSK